MARSLRFKFTEAADQLPRASTGSLERLRVTEGPFPWASLETYPATLPQDDRRGAAQFECAEIDDTGAVAESYGVLMLVAFNVPDARIEEVERWYVEEHVPLLMRAPGWLRARRYRVLQQQGPIAWTHLAFHELRNQAVLDSPERAYARSTPWRAILCAEPWFEQAGRLLFEPITP